MCEGDCSCSPSSVHSGRPGEEAGGAGAGQGAPQLLQSFLIISQSMMASMWALLGDLGPATEARKPFSLL